MLEAVPSVRTARVHAWNHWGSDGLYIFVTGLTLLLIGLAALWSHTHSGLGEFLGVLRVVGFLFLAEEALAGKVVGWLKARITYPRTGYVARPQSLSAYPDAALLSSADQERLRKDKWLGRWIGGTVALFLLGVFLPGRHNLITLACFVIACCGCLWIALLLKRGWQTTQFPWYVLLVMPIYGGLLAFWPSSFEERVAFGTIVAGAFYTVVGTAALFLFLKKHPALQA